MLENVRKQYNEILLPKEFWIQFKKVSSLLNLRIYSNKNPKLVSKYDINPTPKMITCLLNVSKCNNIILIVANAQQT
jgi:hypothetical protein